MPLTQAQITSRRRFIQFLAASPLFAGTSRFGAGRGGPYPERPADPFVWAPRDYDHLISNPKEAIDVFDFEPVMRQNVPPAHFGYMASGIDDDVTLRANRAGLPEIPAAAAPARRCQQGRHEHRNSRHRNTPRRSSSPRPAATRPITPTARRASREAAKTGDHLMILSTQASTVGRRRDQGARRGRSGCSSTPPTSSRSRRTTSRRAEKAGCDRGSPSPSTAPAAATRKPLFRLRAHRYAASATPATTTPASRPTRATSRCTRASISPGCATSSRPRMTWDYLKRLRDMTKMKVVIKGLLAWEDAKLAAETGYRRHHRVEPRRPQPRNSGRSTIDALPEIIEAVNGTHADPDRFRLPPRHRHRQGAVHGRHRRRRRPALSVGRSAHSASRASSACWNSCASSCSRDAAGRRAVDQGSQAFHGVREGVK